jgi:hypothetical protein
MSYRITSQREARRIFRDDVKPYVVERYGPRDTVALDEAWNEWTDQLHKERRISARAYDRWTRTD